MMLNHINTGKQRGIGMCPETYENVLRRFSVSLCVNFHQNLFINRMSRSVRQKK